MDAKAIRLEKTSKPSTLQTSTLQPSLVTLRTIIQFLNVLSKIFGQHLIIEKFIFILNLSVFLIFSCSSCKCNLTTNPFTSSPKP
jgi:hypothetical protein